jgi:hypothetical protein
MQSEIEKYVSQKLHEFGEAIRNRDRGVVIGAVLSFTPIFPACIAGVAISAINILLIWKGRLARSENNLVKISLFIGCLNSIGWVYLLYYFGGEFFPAINYILDVLLQLLMFFEVEDLGSDWVNQVDS